MVVTAPVAGSSTTPAGHVPAGATVALPPVPSVAGKPFTLSLAATFAMTVPATPAVAVPASAVGWMFAATITVSVTVPQSGGALRSHS